ncbi:MAG TPA: hypothetical protein VHC69_35445 [Polyangiaceae bacterium]|nr:hypothetical protein [Polyangiaceae bacterium]
MLGLTSGELFVVVFITVSIVSAPYWQRAGEAIAVALAERRAKNRTNDPG